MIEPAQKDDALISEHIVLTCRLNRLSAYRQLGKDHNGKGEYCSDCRGPLADHRVDCCGFHGFPGRVPGPSRKPSSDGGIIGSISIGNVYPLCSATPTTTPAPSYYYEIAGCDNALTFLRSASDSPGELDPSRWLHTSRNLQDLFEPGSILLDLRKLLRGPCCSLFTQ